MCPAFSIVFYGSSHVAPGYSPLSRIFSDMSFLSSSLTFAHSFCSNSSHHLRISIFVLLHWHGLQLVSGESRGSLGRRSCSCRGSWGLRKFKKFENYLRKMKKFSQVQIKFIFRRWGHTSPILEKNLENKMKMYSIGLGEV